MSERAHSTLWILMPFLLAVGCTSKHTNSPEFARHQVRKRRGSKKNAGMAMRFFLRSAMQGYTPAMANIGTLYEMGAAGRPNFHRTYAWVRTALSFGVPEENRDATLLNQDPLSRQQWVQLWESEPYKGGR